MVGLVKKAFHIELNVELTASPDSALLVDVGGDFAHQRLLPQNFGLFGRCLPLQKHEAAQSHGQRCVPGSRL